MTKIVLDSNVTNIDSALGPYNNNFQKVEDELQNKVLYRDNPVGEPNAMNNPLDMNGNRIYNLPEPQSDHEPVRLVDIGNAIAVSQEALETSNQALAQANATDAKADAIDAATLKKAANLSDVSSASAARTNLGLGTAATQNSGTFLQTADNLSDVPDKAVARTNLGLGTAAVEDVGTFATAAQGGKADTALQSVVGGTGIQVDNTDPQNPIVSTNQAPGMGFLEQSKNLSDLTNVPVARTNLGLGTAATSNVADFATAAQGSKADSAVQAVMQGLGTVVDNTNPNNPIVSVADTIQWLGVPIGDYIVPYSPPPTDNPAYRYILLTAGQDGAGGYNEGVLTGETVTGTAPLIEATAIVSLAGSPLNGQTIHLINTEGRFVGAGVSEAFENDTIQNITGSMGANIVSSLNPNPSGAFWQTDVQGIQLGGTGSHGYSVFIFDASRTVRTSNHTQPRARRAPHYMRIL